MGIKRSMERILERTQAAGEEGPRAEFARDIGAALERFGQAGFSLDEAWHSFLRYAAQTAIMDGASESRFSAEAINAYTVEMRTLRAKGQQGGKS